MKKMLALLTLFFGGFLFYATSDVKCKKEIPQEPVCNIPEDCEGLPHLQVKGNWKCVNGACIWKTESNKNQNEIKIGDWLTIKLDDEGHVICPDDKSYFYVLETCKTNCCDPMPYRIYYPCENKEWLKEIDWLGCEENVFCDGDCGYPYEYNPNDICTNEGTLKKELCPSGEIPSILPKYPVPIITYKGKFVSLGCCYNGIPYKEPPGYETNRCTYSPGQMKLNTEASISKNCPISSPCSPPNKKEIEPSNWLIGCLEAKFYGNPIAKNFSFLFTSMCNNKVLIKGYSYKSLNCEGIKDYTYYDNVCENEPLDLCDYNDNPCLNGTLYEFYCVSKEEGGKHKLWKGCCLNETPYCDQGEPIGLPLFSLFEPIDFNVKFYLAKQCKK